MPPELARQDIKSVPIHGQMAGLFVLLVLYIAGLAIAHWIGLPIPGSILGMILLLGVLILRRGDFPAVRAATDVVLALIPLFLLPICISMAMSLSLSDTKTWLMIAMIALATVLGIIITAALTKLLFGKAAGPEPVEAVAGQNDTGGR